MPEKTVAEKLLIKEGYRVSIVNPPTDYLSTTGKLPGGVTRVSPSEGRVDLIQLFVSSRKELEASLPGLKADLKNNGLIWVTYPKGTSKVKADINRDTIAEYAKSLRLQPVAMVSVDETWSALRLRVVS